MFGVVLWYRIDAFYQYKHISEEESSEYVSSEEESSEEISSEEESSEEENSSNNFESTKDSSTSEKDKESIRVVGCRASAGTMTTVALVAMTACFVVIAKKGKDNE